MLEKPINFENLDSAHVPKEEIRRIKRLAIKQLSRARFEIKGNKCYVKILLDDSICEVFFTNNINHSTFENEIYLALSHSREPSLEFMYDKMYYFDKPLLVELKHYQDTYYKLGAEFEAETWFKLYSKEQIVNDMRDLYQARWIDYEEQLENGTIIYDEYTLNGLWAMPLEMILECFSDVCKERYGDNLFILRTVSDCRYLYDGKEIIGDSFEVIEKLNLNEFHDIGKLCKIMKTTGEEKHNVQIKELELYIERLRSKLTDEMRAYDKLKYMNKMNVLMKWLWLFSGIIIGFVLQGLF